MCEAGHLQSILEPVFSFSKLGYNTQQAHLGLVEIKGMTCEDNVRSLKPERPLYANPS